MFLLLAAGCRSSSVLSCATKICRSEGKLSKVSEDKSVNVVLDRQDPPLVVVVVVVVVYLSIEEDVLCRSFIC